MGKDFKRWHSSKEKIDNREIRPYFYEREIWWCSMGVNVGYEQDGKGRDFSRPILVFKKFNKEVFIGLPLTTKPKVGRFYFSLKPYDGMQRKVILSQIRLFDSKRLQEKLSTLSLSEFNEIKKTLIQLLE